MTATPVQRILRRASAFFLAINLSLLFLEPVQARGPVRSLLEIRREKAVIQEWDLSCGAAALTTVLNYQFGELVGEKEIAKALMARKEYLGNPGLVQARQGFSLLDLKRVSEARGFVGTGYGKMAVGDLVERAPVIVPITASGYSHFVIFRGLLRDRILLADPAFGNYTMPIGKFEDAWIDYPSFGQVGFVVSAPPGRRVTNGLAPRPHEFMTFR